MAGGKSKMSLQDRSTLFRKYDLTHSSMINLRDKLYFAGVLNACVFVAFPLYMSTGNINFLCIYRISFVLHQDPNECLKLAI